MPKLATPAASLHRSGWKCAPDLSRPFQQGIMFLLGGLLLITGCAYRFGHQSLYPCDVRTVHVPIFDSISFRRGLGERLTEAVVREIELRTPYKVVDSDGADSVLSGRIVLESKGVLLYAPTAEARNNQTNLRVEVSWIDRRGGALQPTQTVPMPSSLVSVDQAQNFIPEVGQSIITAEQQAIERLARQIVSLMEAPW